MGLLNETKGRRKLQLDPNNTKWTRDTTTFGQKILRAQGWQPGEFLGAKDAPHSELHGAANASYIRVALKDDMKGLGFDKRKEDEVTGLAEFSDLLSRLNGKSEKKIKEEQDKRLVFKTNAFVASRYGAMRFVRGGLLVGDEMKTDGVEKEDQHEREDEEPKEKSKKRKAESLSEDEDDSTQDDKAERKKRRKEEKKDKKSKSKKSKSDDTDEPSTAASEHTAERRSSSSKRKVSSSSESSEDDEPKKSKSERKEEKRARKEQKKKDKEEKKRKKAEAKLLKASASEVSSALPSSGGSTPAGSGASTPRPPVRGHVRSRFLAAKREALSNDKALAKIWMVKT